MEITINTPALLFPAMSLILLAYTNRFNTLASLIRRLHAEWKDSKDPAIHNQIRNLRMRARLIRDMQGLGVTAMLACVICMFLIYEGLLSAATWTFAGGLLMLIISLALSVWEIWISTDALQLELADMETEEPGPRRYRFFGPRKKKHNPPAHPPGPFEGGPGATFEP